jgi:hypothetical protein
MGDAGRPGRRRRGSRLQREIAEESSCRIEVGDLVGLYSRISAPALLVALFRCTHTGGDPRPQDDDRLEAGWFSFEEARRLVTQPVTAGRIADALADHSGVVHRTYRLHPYEVLAEQVV